MSNNIAIIGGGASCISFIDAIIKISISDKINNLSIVIIEKSKEIGPGNAYSSDSKFNILNTKAGSITVFKDRVGDFYSWLECNEHKWRKYFSDLTVEPDSYVPRSLFGIYMRDSFDYICNYARYCGIKINVIRDEAIGVKQDKNGWVQICTKKNAVINAEKLLLACGTQNKSELSPPYSKNILKSPYPTMMLKQKISSKERVAVIGSRLSAIDAIITLVEDGHSGPITMYSRSGYFPFVRGTQGRYQNTFLSPDYITENFKSLNFYDLGDLYLKECDRYRGYSEESDFEGLPLPNLPIDDLEAFLDKELRLANTNRAWQAILYDTNRSIDKIWDLLCKKDKESFMTRYFSSAMSLRVSIPAENARKIINYLRSGQLKFVSGNSKVMEENGILTVQREGKRKQYDKVIYATGSPRSLSQVDSLLVRDLVDSGIGIESEFGGLDVCRRNYGLFNKSGEMSSNIFAIGELTSGRFLFTSALDIILKHAHACANSIARCFIEESSSFPKA
ncbi:SidA/IucD/PvdA family monooxygenase [Vibrio sp. OCN044]|uniref:SidA/IucD/PvdA family monooxygenase n=1 Tax=Vibrio tetraodonis subsp. pristinus TaxID=2695891 RepID=A0A6L8M108_9VIBR|nr:FAD/NAD(P)-binding protein [Vibrio tetraodonis]MYM59279.1 SidA/IucD/PvdA family monooxygenase [Vibrio tetraodonis subsp. pristinus]